MGQWWIGRDFPAILTCLPATYYSHYQPPSICNPCSAGFIPHDEQARQEPAALAEAIAKMETEIDARVKGLYGV